jgi:hypothetical protein
MTVRVLIGGSRVCKRDGHTVALRAQWDVDIVRVTPFCEVCRMIGLPSAATTDPWLMEIVDGFRHAPDATEQQYEALF